VARSTLCRGLLTFLLVLAVSANGATPIVAATAQDGQCSAKGHPCGGASIASCCCKTPVHPLPSTRPDGRADGRPSLQVAAVAPPSTSPGGAPPSSALLRVPPARPSVPLIILFSTLLI